MAFLSMTMKDVKKSMEKHVLRKIKVFSDKQINNTIDELCLFLCYQPKVPKELKRKVK
mgnify:CR=1 FL=1